MADNTKQVGRRPGSQVAPNQKPFHRPGQTATTHSRVPIEQATANKLYRVRDKMDANGMANIWGELLKYEDAIRLKEKIVTSRQSKTARVEEMTPEDIAAAQGIESTVIATGATEVGTSPEPTVPDYTRLQGGDLFRELGDDATKWADAFVQHATQAGIRLSKKDEGMVLAWFASAIESRPRPTDKQLEAVRGKALAAVAPIAKQAQVRASVPSKPKRVVESAPATPPPSPLSDEMIEDGPAELPPDEEVSELDAGDVADITADVGGGPSADDAQRARAQAERDVAEMTAAARVAYNAAVRDHAGTGPWPTFEQLGDFEIAAWKFYAANGGVQPELVKEPRKVAHAMGSVP